jgi:two-component system response regulator FixJ
MLAARSHRLPHERADRLTTVRDDLEADPRRALASERPNKVIAFDLGISERTVEVHRSRMMKQLEVRHIFEAIRIAVLAGLARAR